MGAEHPRSRRREAGAVSDWFQRTRPKNGAENVKERRPAHWGRPGAADTREIPRWNQFRAAIAGKLLSWSAFLLRKARGPNFTVFYHFLPENCSLRNDIWRAQARMTATTYRNLPEPTATDRRMAAGPGAGGERRLKGCTGTRRLWSGYGVIIQFNDGGVYARRGPIY